MKKKFAFFLMGEDFTPERDRAVFETENMVSCLYTVTGMDEAVRLAAQCAREGFGVIELCGAFGQAGAQRIREAAGRGVGVGYVMHHPEQDALFAAFFGGN